MPPSAPAASVRQRVEGNGDSIVDHKIGHRRRNHWHDEDIDQKVRQADHRGAVELRKRLYFLPRAATGRSSFGPSFAFTRSQRMNRYLMR